MVTFIPSADVMSIVKLLESDEIGRCLPAAGPALFLTQTETAVKSLIHAGNRMTELGRGTAWSAVAGRQLPR